MSSIEIMEEAMKRYPVRIANFQSLYDLNTENRKYFIEGAEWMASLIGKSKTTIDGTGRNTEATDKPA